ncbi:MAG: Uma2 family endonuclease [Acidobacteriota bacterium]|nr:Uma2 family endonuclease [Acidobacteriota bacterium]
MATGTLISVEQYLKTSYRPDCDYVDGEVLERNLGEFEHGSMQGEIVHFIKTRYPRLRWRVVPEQRVQVKATRFRVPDVCLLGENAPRERIIRTAPILCVEILSPADTMARITERIKDYFEMGVPVCWIVDPINRVGWIATPGHLDDATDGILRAGEIEMPLAEVLE